MRREDMQQPAKVALRERGGLEMELICFLRNKEGHMIQCYSGSDGPKGLDDKDIELLRQERTEGEETADVQLKLASKSTLEVQFSISLR